MNRYAPLPRLRGVPKRPGDLDTGTPGRGCGRLDVATEVVSLSGVPQSMTLPPFLEIVLMWEPVGVDDLAVEDEVGVAIGLRALERFVEVWDSGARTSMISSM